MNTQIDLTQLPVAQPFDWRMEFGLFLRNTPSQKRKMRSRLALEAYERDMKLMAAWFEARYGVAFEPCQLNTQNVGEYFAQFESAPATHKRKLASLRLFVRWALGAEALDHDPSEWVAYMDVVEETPRDLTDEERCQLEGAAEAGEGALLGLRDSVLVYLMLEAGLRISEATGLLLNDLHLDKHHIRVLGKGKKRRTVRVGSHLIGKIRLWLDRKPDSIEGTLITDEKGFAICRQTAWERFVLLRDATGVDATPHSLRHTFIKRSVAAYLKVYPGQFGSAIKYVAKQTGDSEMVILKYYSSPSDSEMRAAAEAM